MPDIDVCPQCGIPLYISNQHEWLNNGVIRSRREETQRLVFFECGNLDPLFESIAEIIGRPIEHMVIDTSRRSTRNYIKRVVPKDIKDMIQAKEIGFKPVFDSTFLIWRAMGYGKLSLEDYIYEHEKDDYITILAERPYSVPLAVGNFAGSIEALIEGEPGVKYEETLLGIYKITIFRSQNPPELKKRLRWKDYGMEYKQGDIEMEMCPGCGIPAALGEFNWDQENGSIRNTVTGRRMVMIGPSMIEPIFDDLESELGEIIPQVVVEAQRRFIKSGFFSVREVIDEDNMRTQFALRGMGNIKELQMGKKGVRILVENIALPRLAAGLIQGLYEKALDVESTVEWETSDDGNLIAEVTPRG